MKPLDTTQIMVFENISISSESLDSSTNVLTRDRLMIRNIGLAGAAESDPMSLDKVLNTFPEIDDIVLAQHILCLYTYIFVQPRTSDVVISTLNNIGRMLYNHTTNSQANVQKIVDPVLNEYLGQYYTSFNIDVPTLLKLTDRIPLKHVFPQVEDIIKIIRLVYDMSHDVRYVEENVRLYFPFLYNVNDNTRCNIGLAPGRYVFLDSNDIRKQNYTKSLYWRLIFSVTDIGSSIYDYLYLLADTALPLDPVPLIDFAAAGLVNRTMYGIPFSNYINMYFFERANLGNNTLTRDGYDIYKWLSYRMFEFCGTGAFIVSDTEEVRYFLDSFISDTDVRSSLTVADRSLVDSLAEIICGYRSKNIEQPYLVAVEKLSAGLEAEGPDQIKLDADTPDEGEDDQPDESPDNPDEDSEDTPELDEDENSDETEPQEDAGFGDEDPNQTDDNDIAQANDDSSSDGEAFAQQSGQGKFIPLASSDETLDDHLLRLMVLSGLEELLKNPDTHAPPVNLSILKLWCNQWLFIASIETTRKLLAQLNLSGLIKE